ncbi:T9SS type A sorting domain-containing protein [Gracilimonas sp.]|uniref:zinc-dependent metalloprotease n=1 Tax=Gracilimonas sp. TaxID=1974203 RepID=UPI003BA8E012
MKNLLPLTVLSLLLFSGVATAQDQPVLKINSIESTSVQKASDDDADKTYFSLSEDILESDQFAEGVIFELETARDQIDVLRLVKKRSYRPGITSYMAADVENPENKFSFSYGNGRLVGMYHEDHSSTVMFAVDQEIGKPFLTRNKSILGHAEACAVHESESLDDIPYYKTRFNQDKMSRTKQKNAVSFGAPAYASVEDSITIDLMLVYTDSAESWANNSGFGSIDFVLAQSMNLSQTALDNSETRIELRLAHVHKTIYRGDNNEDIDAGTHLRRFTQDEDNPSFGQNDEYDGYMEEVHDLRDEYGADLVALIMSEPNTGGIAWVLNDVAGTPIRGFSVNRVQQVASNYTLIHEIGHNMGNSHSRTQSSAAASESGALFHYSVGFQNIPASYVTVMAYNEPGQQLQEAPIFASPNLIYNGSRAGSEDRNTPANSALTLKQIKRAIAGYRATYVDSPVVSVSTDQIEVTLNREDEITVPFSISNDGKSGLVWDIDFDFPGQTVSKVNSASAPESDLEPVFVTNPVRTPANYSVYNNNARKKSLNEEVLYSTSFENFPSGEFGGYREWRSLTNTDFIIEQGNASDGSRNLRLSHDPTSDNTQFVAAPFFGYLPLGNYELSLDFKISGAAARSETFDFYIFDGKNGQFSSGVIISDSTLYAAGLNENDQLVFFGTNVVMTANSYGNLRIVYNTDEEVIQYYYKGNMILETGFLYGRTPSELQVVHRNEVSDTHFDVDNIELKQLSTPYDWLAFNNMSGVAFEDSSSDAELVFNTRGISAGTYETILQVSTNDPVNRLIEVPVTLNVNQEVANETEEVPEQVTLQQNYPNPFNPTTSIRFNLNQASKVKLDVFNIQGQKVATLLNENRTSGEHQITFNAQHLSSGIYIYRLQTGAQTLTRKMVLIK